MGFLSSVFSGIWTELYPFFPVFGQKQENMDQRKPVSRYFSYSGVLVKEFWFFVKLEIEDLRQYCRYIFWMVSTKCAQQPYFIVPITRKHIFSTSTNNAKQLSEESRFYTGKAL